MVRVYHLWLSTKITATNAPTNPVVPVIPASIGATNVNSVSWQVDWDALFKGYNKKYKRCSVKFQLNSDSFTATSTDWEVYNGVLVCSLASNSTGQTISGTPLGLINPTDCPTTGTTTHCFTLNTMGYQQGVDVLLPSGNTFFNLAWYRSDRTSLITNSLVDYQILLQFELSEPFDEKDC